ncbi:MAG: hypothetical protein EXR69_06810 [Myxococcales bacterium]|nr:hypothetical protein [Myxococcales bacterium]
MEVMYVHVGIKAAHDVPVFSDAVLRDDFFSRCDQFVKRGGAVCAYALMPNHAHLLVTSPGHAELGAALRDVLAPLARFRNGMHAERGPIFVRPSWRRDVTTDEHLDYLPFYIHANPVPRFTDVHQLHRGRETSHSAWRGDDRPSWLQPDALLARHGGWDGFVAYCEARRDPERGQSQLPLFLETEVLLALGRVARATGVNPNTTLDSSRGGTRDRKLAAWMLHRHGVLAQRQIVDLLKAPPMMLYRWRSAVDTQEEFAEARTALDRE